MPDDKQSEDSLTNQVQPVPEDMVRAGHDTNMPQADSPESLDQEIAEGADRMRIDPQHSIIRPEIDNIDDEANGAD
jgi:hypothetical protein